MKWSLILIIFGKYRLKLESLLLTTLFGSWTIECVTAIKLGSQTKDCFPLATESNS